GQRPGHPPVAVQLLLDRLDAEPQPAELAPPVTLAEAPARFQVLQGGWGRDLGWHDDSALGRACRMGGRGSCRATGRARLLPSRILCRLSRSFALPTRIPGGRGSCRAGPERGFTPRTSIEEGRPGS